MPPKKMTGKAKWFGGFEPDPSDPSQQAGGGSNPWRSASQRGIETTNSVDRQDGQLRRRSRQQADANVSNLDLEDTCVIAIFSRENARQHANGWEEKVEHDSRARVTESSLKDAGIENVDEFVARQSTSRVDTDFETQMRALLANKTIPHVVSVVEGKEEKEKFSIPVSINGKPISITYTKRYFLEGESSSGTDHRRSFGIYVRDDMIQTYTMTEELVPRGSEFIRCVGVNYKTEDDKSYRSLIVHIPNDFAKPSQVAATHKAFTDYAATVQSKSQVIVTGYVGDTNYHKPILKDSVASMGGIPVGGSTYNPQGSGAAGERNFMQSVTMRQEQATASFSVHQPSTLNYVFIDTDDANRTATDHPSIIAYTSHPSPIVGRDSSKLLGYYG